MYDNPRYINMPKEKTKTFKSRDINSLSMAWLTNKLIDEKIINKSPTNKINLRSIEFKIDGLENFLAILLLMCFRYTIKRASSASQNLLLIILYVQFFNK